MSITGYGSAGLFYRVVLDEFFLLPGRHVYLSLLFFFPLRLSANRQGL